MTRPEVDQLTVADAAKRILGLADYDAVSTPDRQRARSGTIEIDIHEASGGNPDGFVAMWTTT